MSNVMRALLATLLFSTVPVLQAQPASESAESMQALRAAVAQDKKGTIGNLLQLSEAEARKFWPIYEEYQRKLEASDRRRVRALEASMATDKSISDTFAKSLSTEMLMADEAEVKARRAMHGKLMRALPGKKAAQYIQLETRLRAAKMYDMAGAMPLIK